jgi:hypothetical protein
LLNSTGAYSKEIQDLTNNILTLYRDVTIQPQQYENLTEPCTELYSKVVEYIDFISKNINIPMIKQVGPSILTRQLASLSSANQTTQSLINIPPVKQISSISSSSKSDLQSENKENKYAAMIKAVDCDNYVYKYTELLKQGVSKDLIYSSYIDKQNECQKIAEDRQRKDDETLKDIKTDNKKEILEIFEYRERKLRDKPDTSITNFIRKLFVEKSDFEGPVSQFPDKEYSELLNRTKTTLTDLKTFINDYNNTRSQLQSIVPKTNTTYRETITNICDKIIQIINPILGRGFQYPKVAAYSAENSEINTELNTLILTLLKAKKKISGLRNKYIKEMQQGGSLDKAEVEWNTKYKTKYLEKYGHLDIDYDELYGENQNNKGYYEQKYLSYKAKYIKLKNLQQ